MMGIDIFWDDVEPDILRIEFSGEWTQQVREEISRKTRAMLGSGTRRSDVIIHIHAEAHFPRFLPPSQIRRTVQTIPDNPGVRVVIGAPAVMQAVLDVFSMLIGGKMDIEMISAKTLDEARSIIRHKREKPD